MLIRRYSSFYSAAQPAGMLAGLFWGRPLRLEKTRQAMKYRCRGVFFADKRLFSFGKLKKKLQNSK